MSLQFGYLEDRIKTIIRHSPEDLRALYNATRSNSDYIDYLIKAKQKDNKWSDPYALEPRIITFNFVNSYARYVLADIVREVVESKIIRKDTTYRELASISDMVDEKWLKAKCEEEPKNKKFKFVYFYRMITALHEKYPEGSSKPSYIELKRNVKEYKEACLEHFPSMYIIRILYLDEPFDSKKVIRELSRSF